MRYVVAIGFVSMRKMREVLFVDDNTLNVIAINQKDHICTPTYAEGKCISGPEDFHEAAHFAEVGRLSHNGQQSFTLRKWAVDWRKLSSPKTVGRGNEEALGDPFSSDSKTVFLSRAPYLRQLQ